MKEYSNLDPLEVKILKFLASRSGATAGLVCQETGISQIKTDYYLCELEKAGFVMGSHFYGGRQSSYQIAQKGREYLIVNNLVE